MARHSGQIHGNNILDCCFITNPYLNSDKRKRKEKELYAHCLSHMFIHICFFVISFFFLVSFLYSVGLFRVCIWQTHTCSLISHTTRFYVFVNGFTIEIEESEKKKRLARAVRLFAVVRWIWVTLNVRCWIQCILCETLTSITFASL